MAKERILITVKTYPIISEKYGELCCTAGFKDDGSWIRLYPIQYRLLEEGKRYEKYRWIEADITKNDKDGRPESYRVITMDNFQLQEKIGTESAWEERRRMVLEKAEIHTNLNALVDLAHQNKVSLAVFKPSEIMDFIAEDAEPEYPPEKIAAHRNRLNQGNLFEGQNPEDFKPVRKLPKKFFYRFKDDAGRPSRMMIEDWETAQLYWNCLKKYNNQTTAIEKVKEKYLDDFARTKDLYFFLGTTLQGHIRRWPNPFVIIGTFHPPFVTQPGLL